MSFSVVSVIMNVLQLYRANLRSRTRQVQVANTVNRWWHSVAVFPHCGAVACTERHFNWRRPPRSVLPRSSCASRMRNGPAIVALGLFVALIAGCDSGGSMMMAKQLTPAEFKSNGERIYFTGFSTSGEPVTYSGGNMHLQMMGGGCATCHGASRRGARMMPQFWLVAPPLTRDALFAEHKGEQEHGVHDSYDLETLQRAIARGMTPSGELLDPTMPRWSMGEADWRDLLTYLRE